MSRRIIALSLLLAGAVSLGGWLVVGPAVATRGPSTAEPAIELDTPADPARFASAGASAAPSSPTTIAASPAASNGQDDRARCGEDQLPEYRTPDPDADGVVRMEPPVPDADGVIRRFPGETKAAGVGYTGAMQRVDASLRSSGDPYDQAVADALNIGGLQSQEAQMAAVVQDAEAGHDARVEALAFAVCEVRMRQPVNGPPVAAASACARLNAHDWARDDPGNGVPWLYALQQADLAGDRAAQREAMLQLAAATRFDTRFGLASAAVAGVRVRSDADLAAQFNLASQAIGLGLGAPFYALTSRCRDKPAGGDAEMAATCDAIAGRMIDRADSFLTQVIGGSIHKKMTGDGTRLEQIRGDVHAFAQRSFALNDGAPCTDEREFLRRMVLIGRHGQVALAKEEQKNRAPR